MIPLGPGFFAGRELRLELDSGRGFLIFDGEADGLVGVDGDATTGEGIAEPGVEGLLLGIDVVP